MKIGLLILTPLIMYLLSLVIYPSPAHAITLSSESYTLELKEINPSKPLLPQPVSNQKPPENISKENYISFYLSKDIIDYGPLSPANPVVRTNTIRLGSGFGSGYSLFGFEDTPLKNKDSDDVIANTTCDSGQCSQERSDVWERSLTFGFGYRCDSKIKDACAKGFDEINTYKQFANESAKQAVGSILHTNVFAPAIEAQLSYKVNIAPTQKRGSYRNTLTFVAAGSY